MTPRLPAPSAPAPLEVYAVHFDDLFATLAQRRGFREYLQGLLLRHDRGKTLTAIVNAEPVVGAQVAPVQQVQFFLSESTWQAEAVNAHRLELVCGDPATMPHEDGVLIIDDSGDRKAGSKTAHVARQYLSSIGKIDKGIVAVTSLWADVRVYAPLHVRPYPLAERLPKARPIRPSAPSRSSRSNWSMRRWRLASPFARWWSTASMGRLRRAAGRLWHPSRSRQRTSHALPDPHRTAPVRLQHGGGGKLRAGHTRRRGPAGTLAGDAAARPRLAGPLDVPRALLAPVAERAPAPGTPSHARVTRPRPSTQPLSPLLTNDC